MAAGANSTVRAAVVSSRRESDDWDSDLRRLTSTVPLQQTWGWGEAQQRLGWRVEHVHLSGGAQALVTLRGTKPFEWAYAPRGPVPASLEAIAALVDWARGRQLAMLRVEPEGPRALGDALRASGFRRGELSEPRNTLIVSLNRDEELLASFHAGTRHKIRKAERLGVAVEVSDDVDELARLIEATYRRQKILMNAKLARTLVRHLPQGRIYLARYGGESLAAIFAVKQGERAYYVAGGSSGQRRELMPNHALQWRAMRDAFREGCVDYDLVGIPPPGEPNHPWHGLYQFKSGFGGTEVEYAGAWDLPLSATAWRVMRVAGRFRSRATNVLGRLAALRW